MAHIRYKYLIHDKDRHGNIRWYVREPGKKKIRIKEEPGTEAFVTAYHAAKAPKPETASKTIKQGSLHWLALKYYASDDFKRKATATQRQRRNILDRICEKQGHLSAIGLTSKTVRAGRDARADTPGAANNMIKTIKALYTWAIDEELVENNPAIGVKRLRPKNPDGFHSWTDEERLQYEQRHPVGTKARLAYALAHYAGARRSDIVLLGRQHMTSDGHLAWTQQKGNKKRVSVPILPPLMEAIEAMPKTGMHFIQTEYGNPFAVASFGEKAKSWMRQAGLPEKCMLHGLRKALGARLAEHGATENQIAAALGHTGTATAKIYTRQADQTRLADEAMSTIQAQSVPPSGTSCEPVGIKSKKGT